MTMDGLNIILFLPMTAKWQASGTDADDDVEGDGDDDSLWPIFTQNAFWQPILDPDQTPEVNPGHRFKILR